MKCIFCNLDRKKNKIVFETSNFIFFEAKDPIFKGHSLLAPKIHITEEKKLPKKNWNEFLNISNKAYNFMKKKYKFAPLTFTNPPQQQSIKHLHKHFIPGIFGILGVDKALRNFLIKKFAK